jgi:hypothetical protein
MRMGLPRGHVRRGRHPVLRAGRSPGTKHRPQRRSPPMKEAPRSQRLEGLSMKLPTRP